MVWSRSPPAATAAPAPQYSAAASCDVEWRVSGNHHGYTVGYSWAWNVVTGKRAGGIDPPGEHSGDRRRALLAGKKT